MKANRRTILAIGLPLLTLLFVGGLWWARRGGEERLQPDRLILDAHASGDNQVGMYERELEKPLRVVVESPVLPGLLGGKGERHPVAGVRVRFRVETANGGLLAPLEGSGDAEADFQPTLDTVTDSAGAASARLRLGRRAGDVTVIASLPDHPHIPVATFRATAGVARRQSRPETRTGGTIDELGVRLVGRDGAPVEGVEVYFRVEGHGQGASVGHQVKRTDTDGWALTTWTLGKHVQQYFASVEIRDGRPSKAADPVNGVDDEERFRARAFEFEAMAMNKVQLGLVLFGALAVFIFGMKMMSEGLQRLADRRLKQVLGFMTQNRVMAVLAGVGVTAIIQSSSATTVMVVGFVNAGIMTLQQAIGVIFGANVGTTVTAQIISFNIEEMSYPAITLGFVLVMFFKRPYIKSLGESILGFGLLFLGMMTMSGILRPLRYSPEFVSWFQLFDCTPADGEFMQVGPVLSCILIGTVMTCVIQSSSATVGLVMALASQGLISFYTAVPLVLGDNIGTTITANLAAIGANRNARRAALAHTLFNVFGAACMFLLFFLPWWEGRPVFLGLIDAITPGQVFAVFPENILRHVANAHSLFNIVNCLLFLPFVAIMARVCETIIPITDADRDTVLRYLEPRLLQTPSIALQQAIREVNYMIQKGQKSINESCEFLIDNVPQYEASVIEREKVIDRLQREISEYLVELSRNDLNEIEIQLMPALIHMINDAERLGDHAEEMLELRHILVEQQLQLSPEALDGVRAVLAMLNRQFDNVYLLLQDGATRDLSDVEATQREIQRFIKQSTDDHVKRLDEGVSNIQAGVIYLDALTHLERVNDHLLNIAERAERAAKVTAS
ncbi:MAG TPA: Na/Pi cotransporter family protein [Candidatus Hydrogenedentes bacterium]|nr:Na/Pi cotransporter family protein [Candidatus Hydrogenedentota bacterium]